MSLLIALVVVLFGGVKSEESCEQGNDASEKTGQFGDWKNSGRKSKLEHETGPDLDAPYFEDLWGYKVAWRLEEDGWTDHMRRQMLNLG